MMKIRKSLSVIVFTGIICVLTAHADPAPVSIKELPKQTTSKWQQAYQAYGRTVDVDVDIYIPDADTAPVITVQAAPPIPEPRNGELAKEYKSMDRKDKVNSFIFESTDYWTYIQHAIPPEWGKTKKDEFYAHKMWENAFDLPRYDENQAYAYKNKITVREAFEITQNHILEFFPDIELHLDTIYIGGETYYRKNNQHISKMGCYNLNTNQVFHKIPFSAGIHDTFSDRLECEPNWDTDLKGTVFAEVYSDNAWLLAARLYQETGIVCEDIPLLPFDAVKDQVETLILKGYVRWVNSVTLGYVQYETSNPREQVLLPSWVVWCEYHPDGPSGEAAYGVNDSEMMFDGNNPYYMPLIFNAQTGEMIDPANTAEDRYMCPDLSAWKK